MNALLVVRGVLIRLVQSFAQPDADAVWYRRYLPLGIFLLAVVGGLGVWIWGTPLLVSWVDAWTGGPHHDVGPGVTAALVVAWLALIAFAFTLANIIVPSLRAKPLVLVVPQTLYGWLIGMAAIGVGLLIGTSIFV